MLLDPLFNNATLVNKSILSILYLSVYIKIKAQFWVVGINTVHILIIIGTDRCYDKQLHDNTFI